MMAHWHLNPLATPVGCCLICFPYPCTWDQILQWQRLIWRDKLNHLDLSGVGPRTENSEGGLRFIYLVCIKVKPNDWWLLVFITPSDNYVCRGDDWAGNLLVLTSYPCKQIIIPALKRFWGSKWPAIGQNDPFRPLSASRRPFGPLVSSQR